MNKRVGPFAGPDVDFSNQAVQELLDLLVAQFELQDEIRGIVKSAGVPPGHVRYNLAAYLLWMDVLTVAQRHDRREALFLVIKQRSGKGLGARIDALLSDRPVLAAPSAPAVSTTWKGGPEVMTGARSSLLDIAFLAHGLAAAAAVCKLTLRSEEDGGEWWGTGFLIEPDLVLTNQHVLFSQTGEGPAAGWVQASFVYGPGEDEDLVAGVVGSIDGGREHDWAIVRLVRPVTKAKPLRLGSETPLWKGDPTFIIQHPGGGPKQIGLYRNEIRHFDEQIVHYLTDTRRGSSGSPVFNKAWEVIALHHSWIESDEGNAAVPGGAGGTPFGGEIRNEGVRIERVLEALKDSGVNIAAGVAV